VRRNWFIAAIVIGVVAIVVAAVVMRSTEDAPPSASEWADSICTSLSEWKASIESIADVSGETLTPELLREKLDDASSATSDLVTELRDLGAPDLESGDQLEEELDASISDLEASFEDLRQSAEEAADAPAGEFLQALAGLAPEFAALQAEIGTTVSNLENANVAEDSKAELQQAFADSPSCQSLQAVG
jgi:DNA repair exonuclease SbcCD ATPase subunit